MKTSLFTFLIIFCGLLPGAAQDNPFGMKSVKPEGSYTFSSSMTYKLSTTDRKGKSNAVTSQYFFSPKATFLGVKMLSGLDEAGQAGIDFMIIDISQARMFTFMKNKMMIGIAIPRDKFNEMVEKENAAITVTRTSEAKTIMGYECEGYKVKNEKDKADVIMWVSRQKVEALANLASQMAGAFTGSGKGAQSNYFAYNAHPELARIAQEGRGILGYTTKSDRGEVTEMELTAMEPQMNYTFNTSTYKSMF